MKSETKGAMNKNWQGPTRATIWGMNHRDGTLSPEWEDFKLIPVVNLGKKFEQPLEVVVDFDAFARKYPGWAAVVRTPVTIFWVLLTILLAIGVRERLIGCASSRPPALLAWRATMLLYHIPGLHLFGKACNIYCVRFKLVWALDCAVSVEYG